MNMHAYVPLREGEGEKDETPELRTSYTILPGLVTSLAKCDVGR